MHLKHRTSRMQLLPCKHEAMNRFSLVKSHTRYKHILIRAAIFMYCDAMDRHGQFRQGQSVHFLLH
jgi:hypothetical protein